MLSQDKAIEMKCVSYLYFTICGGMRMKGLASSEVTTPNDKLNFVTFEQMNDLASCLYKPDQLRIFVMAQPGP